MLKVSRHWVSEDNYHNDTDSHSCHTVKLRMIISKVS